MEKYKFRVKHLTENWEELLTTPNSHVHRTDILLRKLHDYPVHLFKY